MATEYTPTEAMDRDSRSNRYFRNAVERHWDPVEIDLAPDRRALLASDVWYRGEPRTGEDRAPFTFNQLRTLVAMFGAGETEVTEDLGPLAVVLEDVDDQLFVTSQIYEESKHVEFFDRYWREVINPVEEEMGYPRSEPTEDRWYPEGYLEVLGRNTEAMHRLLSEDTPETRAVAYCHYHLTVEAIIAQAGYYVLTNGYGGRSDDMPYLPGLQDGIAHVRADEGRHVGFGLAKVRDLVETEDVDSALVERTIGDLIRRMVVGGDGAAALEPAGRSDRLRMLTHFRRRDTGWSALGLATHIGQKHLGRMDMIAEAAGDIPEADRLTSLETRTDAIAANLRRPRRFVRAVAGI